MRKVVVAGVGMTVFGRFPEKTVEELGAVASLRALKDAGLQPADIQIAYVGNLTEHRVTGHNSCLGQEILKDVGIHKIPITRTEAACASGACAFREAWMAVGSGLYDIALALGVEKLTGAGHAPLTRQGLNINGLAGLHPPGWWASRAVRHMAQYGTTIEQLALVSVKNHANGCLDPYSQFQKKFTVQEIQQSDMIAEPLRTLHMCPISDGGAAAVLCSEEVARRLTTRPVYVAASALTSLTYLQQEDMTFNDLERRAAQQAYEMAALGPEDLAFAEVHDCFTIAEVTRCESLGFCERGEYCHHLEEGKWSLGGKFPVNPSGGLLSKGHPVGATGVAQICELTWHLRGEAGERQVPGATAALGHVSGGTVAGLNGACSVVILKT
ncbi:MAG: thiolase family protein [Chloroflexi bacterium]|nr:thiolase family protein [Chloroflexota bacterium]